MTVRYFPNPPESIDQNSADAVGWRREVAHELNIDTHIEKTVPLAVDEILIFSVADNNTRKTTLAECTGTGTGIGTVLSVDVAVAKDDTYATSGGPITSSGVITETAVDAGADKLVGWDDSADKKIYFTLGTNLSTSGSTLNAASGGHVIEDEGTPLTTRANLNFIGAGVTATDNAGTNSTDVTIAQGLPAAPDTSIQWNNAGAFGGDADMTWLAATNVMTLGSTGTPATIIGGTAATSTSDGAALTVKGGLGGSSSGNGGAVTVIGGVPIAGTGGSVSILGGDGVGTSKFGGDVTIQGGIGIATTGDGGIIRINGGAANGGGGGAVNITGGTSTAAGGSGGQIVLQAGQGRSTGTSITLTAASPSVSGAGGAITLTAANGTSSSAAGGAVIITAGNSNNAVTGGNVNLVPGGSGTGSKGAVTFSGGVNGQTLNIRAATELTTIAAAATTDTTITIPALAIVIAVSVRVTVAIPTATAFDYGIAGATTRYGTAIGVAANTTYGGTDDAFRFYAGATAIRITPNGTPANTNGRVRVTIHFIDVQPPTS